MYPTLLITLLLHLLTLSSAAFCTRSDNVPFTLTTFNTTNRALNNTFVSISGHTAVISLAHIRPPVLLPYFASEGIWRLGADGHTIEQGYMQKRPGTASTGWVFAFSTYPPRDAIKTPWYIGCDGRSRHILGVGEFGYDNWQACVLPSAHPQYIRRELSV